MKQGILSGLIFLFVLGGAAFVYGKIHFVHEPSGFIYEKPVTCEKCGQMMWHGAEAHLCASSYIFEK